MSGPGDAASNKGWIQFMPQSDTSPDVEKEYDERWKQLSPEDRFLKGLSLIALSRKMLMAGLEARHPGLSPEDLKQLFRKQLYGF